MTVKKAMDLSMALQEYFLPVSSKYEGVMSAAKLSLSITYDQQEKVE